MTNTYEAGETIKQGELCFLREGKVYKYKEPTNLRNCKDCFSVGQARTTAGKVYCIDLQRDIFFVENHNCPRFAQGKYRV